MHGDHERAGRDPGAVGRGARERGVDVQRVDRRRSARSNGVHQVGVDGAADDAVEPDHRTRSSCQRRALYSLRGARRPGSRRRTGSRCAGGERRAMRLAASRRAPPSRASAGTAATSAMRASDESTTRYSSTSANENTQVVDGLRVDVDALDLLDVVGARDRRHLDAAERPAAAAVGARVPDAAVAQPAADRPGCRGGRGSSRPARRTRRRRRAGPVAGSITSSRMNGSRLCSRPGRSAVPMPCSHVNMRSAAQLGAAEPVGDLRAPAAAQLVEVREPDALEAGQQHLDRRARRRARRRPPAGGRSRTSSRTARAAGTARSAPASRARRRCPPAAR